MACAITDPHWGWPHCNSTSQSNAFPFPPAALGSGIPQGSCNLKTFQDITILVQKLSWSICTSQPLHTLEGCRGTHYTHRALLLKTHNHRRNKMEFNFSEGKQPFSTRDFHFTSVMAPSSQSRPKEWEFVLMARDRTAAHVLPANNSTSNKADTGF